MAEQAGFANAVELFGTVDRQQFVQETLGEDDIRIGQILAQHVVLIDRQVIGVTRIDFHQADAAALEFELAQALDHDIRIASVAAMADVFDRDLDLPAHGFGVGAAHRVDQSRFAFERHHDVA